MLAVSRQLSAVSLWATDGATVRAVLWNGHLGGMGILVELASCQFHAYFGAGRMPTLPFPDSRFPIPDSRLPTPDSPKSQNPAKK
ncbi:hypothetical protein [Moorena sp. SIO3H5]|uniref:hypothetical protein n=1 Tax=Moorena sp. SIO3H5 TaxID=2607834 RepID=UPI0013B9B699|nr:hypothetical protein [Moorena sp. SIO3H5]NEO72227.1 hypothetical protein [Moorena sp. SIO3H5]